MGAMLEALVELQDIEHQIVDIRRQLTSKERSVARQAARTRAAEEALKTARDDVRHTQIHMDEVDLELKSRNARVVKLREDLNSVRTNKEYAAVLSALNNEKADMSRLEARAFELLSAVEEKKKKLGEHEAAVQQEAQKLANLRAQLEQSRGSFADRLRTLETQRENIAGRLDAKSLEHFNRLSERYDGEVLAKVIQVHPRRQEFLCEGCNMAVNIERANALMSRDDLVTCGSCGRILYIDPNA